ncbi:MAG: dipeptide epimerase [Bacteroidetes bacterium B1(2017)]|nr:MAG: dipeptide epimerase [Bacteroidetes bacterium B1(2017)]
MDWSIEKIKLDLKYTWKISRNASTYKENFIVTCKYKSCIGLGEVAPNIRYNETPENIATAFELVRTELNTLDFSLAEFEVWLKNKEIPNALKFGIESAFVHAYCQVNNLDLFSFLNIEKPKQVASCYTLPIMEAGEIKEFYHTYALNRFNFLKVKVNNEEALEMISALSALGKHPIMIDANEAWKDVEALLKFLPKLKPFPIEFVEQPMPSAFIEEYIYLKKNSPLPIMGDESVLDYPDFDILEKQFHGVNMKLMKAGGYVNGIRILQEAKRRGLKTMIGCMVETTLGIKSAWNLCSLAQYADLDGCLIVGNEPFHNLKEENGIFIENLN